MSADKTTAPEQQAPKQQAPEQQAPEQKQTPEQQAWHALSPLDGRYSATGSELSKYFSEYALMERRVFVEIRYFKALLKIKLPGFEKFEEVWLKELDAIYEDFDERAMARIKEIEARTRHDVKAVEYYIQEKMTGNLAPYKEFIHLALTSQDINNTAIPLTLKDAYVHTLRPALDNLITQLLDVAKKWIGIKMLARTHGQPANYTTLGKEVAVFFERLARQVEVLDKVPFCAKFGGTTGHMLTHHIVYRDIDWESFADKFVQDLGLTRSQITTQIEHYDHLAAFFDGWGRIATILIDFSRDMWQYISMEYFNLRTQAGEVGSSAMPHKVNPIDFENAEGNLGLARAIGRHFSEKLPISRLQRDLSDSTVLRNIGVPLGHLLVAMRSLKRGIEKLTPNESKMAEDLYKHPEAHTEFLQVSLRAQILAGSKGPTAPYETVKKFMDVQRELAKQIAAKRAPALKEEHDKRVKEMVEGATKGYLSKEEQQKMIDDIHNTKSPAQFVPAPTSARESAPKEEHDKRIKERFEDATNGRLSKAAQQKLIDDIRNTKPPA